MSNIFTAPTECSVGNLEKELSAFYHDDSSEKNTNELIIDLDSINYFEIPSMIFLSAFITTQFARNIDVKLILPAQKEMRNLLRSFKFPTVLASLTSKRFQDLVVSDSLIYFGENASYNKSLYGYESSNLLESIVKRKVYTESLPFAEDYEKTSTLHRLRSDWSGEEMQAWLKSHLMDSSNKEKLIPNRVIFECVTNAVRHSGAKNLIFAAIDKTYGSREHPTRFLDISFWDNGVSIVDTLLDSMTEDRPTIDSDFYKDERTKSLQATYYVKYFDESTKVRTNFFLNSDANPKNFSSNIGQVLLSSFFPGISRDPKGLINWFAPPDENEREDIYKHPGMGLTTLLNAVVDIMGGQVSVRTRDYFLNIKRPTDKRPLKKYAELALDAKYSKFYQAKIIKRNSYINFLEGNMLTVRLPLQSANENTLSN